MAVALEALKAVPYLDTAELGDRTVNLMPLWDGERWRQWLATPVGLMEIKVVDVIEVDYVAVEPAKESDLFIPFVHLMWQRGSWPEVCPMIRAICGDFRNMGVSVAKLRFIFDHRGTLPPLAASRFAETELEYIVILTRSVFDLLQEMISILWRDRVKLLDDAAEARRRSRSLPETFSKLVLEDKRELRTASEIRERFGLPEPLAERYASIAPFFSRLRDTRDAIVHSGSESGHLFDTERGFCVDPTTPPFSFFEEWRQEHRHNENLVSVLPWVAHVILGTIDACNGLVDTFASVIKFPPEIAPGYGVYVRGPHSDALREVLRVDTGGAPWWG